MPERRRLGRRSVRWVRTHAAWAGWVSVGAALITVGVILGASLSSSSSSPGSMGATSPGGPAGPGIAPGPVAPSTACGYQVKIGRKPALCVNRNWGYPQDTFVVQGGGFAPRTALRVTMTEIGPPQAPGTVIPPTSPVSLDAGPDGTFRVAVRRLYPTTLPLGIVTVTATGSGGTLITSFIVIPDQAPPPQNAA